MNRERRDESRLGMSLKCGNEFGEDVRLHDVVVIKEEEVFSRGDPRAVVSAYGGHSVFRIARVANARVVAERGADLVARVVRRAVVHDDDLKRGVVRREDGADTT